MKKQNYIFIGGTIFISIMIGALVFLGGEKLQIMPYDFVRDYKQMQTLFEREWHWLIPVSRENYSLDLILKYQAPKQNPLYAGRLKIKVMKKGNNLVGFVAYYMKSADEAFLNFLAINPEYRGKGYGYKLAREAMDDMIERGARRITMVTYPHNIPALTLYKKLGFIEIGRGRQVELEYKVR